MSSLLRWANSIPRSYLANVNGEVTSYELYGFCNASIKAYAAIVYLVLKTEVDSNVTFVVARGGSLYFKSRRYRDSNCSLHFQDRLQVCLTIYSATIESDMFY